MVEEKDRVLVEQLQTFRKTGRWGRAELIGAKAKYLKAQSTWHQVVWPTVLTILLIIFLIGPSISVILGVLGSFNPLIWIAAIIIVLWLWRRYV